MKVSSTVDDLELTEPSKLINRSKTNIPAYKTAVINETLHIGRSPKATKSKLAIDKNRTYALSDEPGNITHNMDEVIKAAERLYTILYVSDARPGETTESASLTCGVALVVKEAVVKSLKDLKRREAAGDDGITLDLLKGREDTAQFSKVL